MLSSSDDFLLTYKKHKKFKSFSIQNFCIMIFFNFQDTYHSNLAFTHKFQYQS